MTGLEEPAADVERAAAELRSALALAGIEALSVGWSAVGGAAPLGLVHIHALRPEAARALAHIVKRGIRTRTTQGTYLHQATAEDLRAALDPLWFRPCRCEERTGVPCPEQRKRLRLRDTGTPGP
ncbi:hypothetical protein B7755_015995 [Streptomyces sp. NBS 14/10]|uniref:hypothetical protein n=1 Tax=Streptomyces sp. NBS 14/10 TaxID=1945643 RepID=UPI000B7F0494|nr:hypothetical protein [Streptomyces sp. NBS 14/10]KAK1179514.1 hypothetical protein B7755_015995 [Streptomyces sp. NBS 14/10]